jgi:ornithine cyclodeaminase/alanine dehydrogenase
MTLLITEVDVAKILTVEDAIPIMEQTFRWAGEGLTENPPRFRMPIKKGFLQFGPAAVHPMNVMGFKLWANFGSPLRQVWNYLFNIETSELEAIIHAFLIGKLRTSAVSAVAVKHLSPPGASTLGLYGTGRQAEAQLEAVCKVRSVKRALVYSRRPEARREFCERMSKKLAIAVEPAERPEDIPREVEIIVTITTAETPILLGKWIERPLLVVAAGANHWYKREIDSDLVANAKLVLVDEKEQAKVEGGNLLFPISHGQLTWDRVEELGDIVAGRLPLPDLTKSLVLFCSHGLAIEDVAISAHAYERAKAKGLGRKIDL